MEWFKAMAKYPDDLAVIAVGDFGELLFFRGCAFCARSDSDGFIPDAQLPRFGLRGVSQLADALVREDLWQRAPGGFMVTNWVVIQSDAYAAERKRRRDRNRQATRRATVARQSQDSRLSVAPLEVEEEPTPLPPASQGGSCDGQHDNCRGCRTTRRQRDKAERSWKPEWCGRCDERTRQIEVGELVCRCPDCHPLEASA